MQVKAPLAAILVALLPAVMAGAEIGTVVKTPNVARDADKPEGWMQKLARFTNIRRYCGDIQAPGARVSDLKDEAEGDVSARIDAGDPDALGLVV